MDIPAWVRIPNLSCPTKRTTNNENISTKGLTFWKGGKQYLTARPNVQVYYTLEHGHTILSEAKTGRFLYDITLMKERERADQLKRDAISKGWTTYELDRHIPLYVRGRMIQGDRTYVDIETGCSMGIVYKFGKAYYIEPNGFFVRKTDDQILKDRAQGMCGKAEYKYGPILDLSIPEKPVMLSREEVWRDAVEKRFTRTTKNLRGDIVSVNVNYPIDKDGWLDNEMRIQEKRNAPKLEYYYEIYQNPKRWKEWKKCSAYDPRYLDLSYIGKEHSIWSLNEGQKRIWNIYDRSRNEDQRRSLFNRATPCDFPHDIDEYRDKEVVFRDHAWEQWMRNKETNYGEVEEDWGALI